MALTQANKQNRLFSGSGHVALMAVIEPQGQRSAWFLTARPASQAPLMSKCASILSITSNADQSQLKK